MISSFKPSVAQTERLEMLIEECAEVIHASTNVLRHGYDSYNPHSDVDGNNREALRRELLDLITVVNMIAFDVSAVFTEDELRANHERKMQYTHCQPKA